MLRTRSPRARGWAARSSRRRSSARVSCSARSLKPDTPTPRSRTPTPGRPHRGDELAGDGQKLEFVVGGLGERALDRSRGEVREPDLDRQRAAGDALVAQPSADLGEQCLDDAVDLGRQCAGPGRRSARWTPTSPGSRSCTSRVSRPRARWTRPGPWLPSTCRAVSSSSSREVAERPDAELGADCSADRGPIPGIARIGRGARNAASSPGRTTVSPSGLSWSLAILATVFVAATPTEAVMPSFGDPGANPLGDLDGVLGDVASGVTSRYASSIDTGCTRGALVGEDRADLLGELLVAMEPRGGPDRVGAQRLRANRRHRRADAVDAAPRSSRSRPRHGASGRLPRSRASRAIRGGRAARRRRRMRRGRRAGRRFRCQGVSWVRSRRCSVVPRCDASRAEHARYHVHALRLPQGGRPVRFGAHVSVAGGYEKTVDYLVSLGPNARRSSRRAPASGRVRRPIRRLRSDSSSCAPSGSRSPVFTHTAYLINLATDEPVLRAVRSPRLPTSSSARRSSRPTAW